MPERIWIQFYDLATLPLLCLLLSCSLGLRYWQRLPRPFQVLVAYLVFNLLIEIGARVGALVFRQNLPLLHLYTLGECWLFSLFYRQILDENSVFKQRFWQIVGSVLALTVLNSIFLQGIFEYNSYGKTLVQVLIILYALDYAFRLSERDDPDPDLTQMLRLVNSAVLIYYCGSLFVFMSSQFEIEMKDGIHILWQVNKILNLIFHLMVLIALWKVIFTLPKSSSSPARAS
jgi:hypothetical protein